MVTNEQFEILIDRKLLESFTAVVEGEGGIPWS
jgi:hypothetical protein